MIIFKKKSFFSQNLDLLMGKYDPAKCAVILVTWQFHEGSTIGKIEKG